MRENNSDQLQEKYASPMLRGAYKRGSAARLAGKALENNPEKTRDERIAWDEGWLNIDNSAVEQVTIPLVPLLIFTAGIFFVWLWFVII